MAALSKLLLQMVTYFQAGSHVKPRRMKTHIQMRVGRNEHKNNVVTQVFGVFCVEHKLNREVVVRVKRQDNF